MENVIWLSLQNSVAAKAAVMAIKDVLNEEQKKKYVELYKEKVVLIGREINDQHPGLLSEEFLLSLTQTAPWIFFRVGIPLY
jgi:hypothetical protein